MGLCVAVIQPIMSLPSEKETLQIILATPDEYQGLPSQVPCVPFANTNRSRAAVHPDLYLGSRAPQTFQSECTGVPIAL